MEGKTSGWTLALIMHRSEQVRRLKMRLGCSELVRACRDCFVLFVPTAYFRNTLLILVTLVTMITLPPDTLNLHRNTECYTSLRSLTLSGLSVS